MLRGFAAFAPLFQSLQPLRSLAAVLAFTLLPQLGAQTIWQGGNGSNANDWAKVGNWSVQLPTATQVAQFDNSANSSNLSPNLGGNQTAAGIIFTSVAPAYTITGNAGDQLTIGSSGITNSSANIQSFSVPVVALGASQSWSVGSTGDLSLSSAVSLGSNALTLTGSSSGAGTISGVVSGTGSLVKAGSGVWTLSGNNTFTGGVTLNAGVLTLGNAGALNSTAGSENAVTFGSGSTGTLRLNGNSVTVANLSSNATVGTPVVENNAAGTATLTVGNSGNQSGTFAGVIQNGTAGTLALTKAGTGTLTLSGANTYTGATTINAGTVSISADSNLGTAPGAATPGQLTLDGGKLSATAGFTLNSNRGIAVGASGGTIETTTGTLSYGGILAGSGTLTKEGGGTLALGAVNAFTGSLTVNSGTVTASELDLAATRSLTIASGALVSVTQGSGTTSTISGSLAGAGTFQIGGSGTTELANAFSASGLTLKLTGGTLLLSGSGTFGFGTIDITGNTTIDFSGANGSTLSSTSLRIASGVSVTVVNHVAGTDFWYASGNLVNLDSAGSPTSTLTSPSNQTSAPLSSISFTSNATSSNYNGLTTTWLSGTGEIRPVPEPSTYGAMLMAGCAGLFGVRRWRAKRRAVRG